MVHIRDAVQSDSPLLQGDGVFDALTGSVRPCLAVLAWLCDGRCLRPWNQESAGQRLMVLIKLFAVLGVILVAPFT